MAIDNIETLNLLQIAVICLQFVTVLHETKQKKHKQISVHDTKFISTCIHFIPI